MHKQQRRSVIILLLMLLNLFLSGCGLWNNDSFTGNEKDMETEGVLRWATWEYSQGDYRQKIIDSFHEKYPNVEIKLIEYPLDQYMEKVTLAFNANEIDVVDIPDTIVYRNLTGQGRLEPLSNYMHKYKMDLANLDRIAEELEINKKIYMLPYEIDYMVLFYNKTVFWDKNVMQPTNLTTWWDFQKKAEEVAGDNLYGAYFDNSWTCAAYPAIADGALDIAKGNYVNELAYFYRMLKKMQNEDAVANPYHAEDTKASVEMFAQGRAAMAPMYLSEFKTLAQRNLNFEWGLAFLPHSQGNTKEKAVSQIYGTAVSAETENKELAFAFAQWRNTDAGKAILAQHQRMPADATSESIEIFINTNGYPDDLISKDALMPEGYTLAFPPDDMEEEIKEALESAHSKIMGEEQEIIIALEQLQKKIERIRSR